MTQGQGIFDELVASLSRIDLGSNDPGQSPAITSGFGVPVAVDATGSIYYRKDAPNASLMLYVRASGAWWPISSANPFVGISVGTEATLTAFDVTGVPDGAQAYVQSHRSYWTLRTQALTLRANELIASSAGNRQWIREPTAHLDWALQYAPNVFVDAGAGNNENDGLTNVTALLNMEEVARRVPVLVQPIIVNYVGASNPATPVTWNPTIRWLSAVSAAAPSITIVGVEQNPAPVAPATGVVGATSTNGTAGTNTPPRFTDTGGAAVAWTPGAIIRALDGVNVGNTAVVIKDEGGGVARTSQWRDPTGALTGSPPAPGDHYALVTQTTFPDFDVLAQIPITLKKIRLTLWSVQNGAGPEGPAYSFQTCMFPTSIGFPAAFPGSTITWFGCSIMFTGLLASVGVLFSMNGCGCILGAPVRVSYGGRFGFTNTQFQGHGVHVAIAADSQLGGQATFNNTAIWDAAEVALCVQRQGQAFIAGALWGSGNAVQGTQARSGGRISVKTGVTPTLASTGQELELENAATANAAPPLGTGVIPVASALINWSQWNAGPFTRNVVSYLTGAAVLDSA